MTTHRHQWTFLIWLLLAPVAAAEAAPGMRCGTWLITPGDAMFEVQTKCGRPDGVSTRHLRYYHVIDGVGLVGSVQRDIVEWVYDFGPRRFMRRLRFHGTVLSEIETLGYGYRE